MTVIGSILSWVLGALIGVAMQAGAPERFDVVVRTDFFAGFAGDPARLARAMDACERTLADNPKHAEALLWHGSGLAFQAGTAFQKGDAPAGMELWTRGLREMDEAVSLAPDDIAVLIPRGAVLLRSTRTMQGPMVEPLLEKGFGDYEKTLAIQAGYFDTLGDHPKGELPFGLAEGYARLGRPDKARVYFERLTKDAPGYGQVPRAREWMETVSLPKVTGAGCVGCHK